MRIEGTCPRPIPFSTPVEGGYDVEFTCWFKKTCATQRVKVYGSNLPTETIHERALAHCTLSCEECRPVKGIN
jgi:hypothetical protein